MLAITSVMTDSSIPDNVKELILFPIILSSNDERLIKCKHIKLKCSIPLKEYSTPFQLATAYIDWFTYILNVQDMDTLIKDCNLWDMIHSSINSHKLFLDKFYKLYNRNIFNKDTGYTICPIQKNILSIKNIADISRDNRININDMDVQMGHIHCRSDEEFTIRGTNLVMMSREGNRIIGEHSFINDKWIQKLQHIITNYH